MECGRISAHWMAPTWALLLNDEPCNFGISMQPIKDGEHYKLVYTPADQ